MTYEDLLLETDNTDIIIKEKNLPISKGRIKGNRIAIHKEMTTIEKGCILAEELGHYFTTSGDILDQTITSNRKQENHARIWAYNKNIGLYGIINCYKAGCRNIYEMSDHLRVTEKFLEEALYSYRNIYGICKRVDNFVIYFVPCLSVLELI